MTDRGHCFTLQQIHNKEQQKLVFWLIDRRDRIFLKNNSCGHNKCFATFFIIISMILILIALYFTKEFSFELKIFIVLFSLET